MNEPSARPLLTYGEFRELGREQKFVQPNFLRYLYLHWIGPLGINARLRSAHVIDTVLHIGLKPRSHLLDVGCGHGYALFWLANRFPDSMFVGLEIDHRLVQAGNKIADHLGLSNIRFVHGDASSLKGSGTYDLVISMDVLEHIEDDVGTLCRIHEAMSQDGHLVLHLPRRHQEARTFLPQFRHFRTPDHVRDEYTEHEILLKLKAARFTIRSMNYSYGKWGELAFETNYLFWQYPPARIVLAMFFQPLSTWLAYQDVRKRHTYKTGNAFVIHAQPVK